MTLCLNLLIQAMGHFCITKVVNLQQEQILRQERTFLQFCVIILFLIICIILNISICILHVNETRMFSLYTMAKFGWMVVESM